MTNHDIRGELSKQQAILERLDPKFNELSLDMQEIVQESKDPAFIAALLFKLVQERHKANEMLARMEEKYDQWMLQLKTGKITFESSDEEVKGSYEVLPEQDQQILKYVEEKGQVTANDIQTVMKYKGLNAASQRLNKLYKEKHLVKVRSGKKVLYLAKA